MNIARIRKRLFIPGLVALAAAAYGLLPARAVSVAGVVLKSRDALETVLATGRIIGEKTIPLAFPRPGRLALVRVENGDRVKSGQLLMQLENEREMNARAQAKTALDVARIGLERASTIDLVEARERVKQAEATSVYAESNFKRQSELLARDTVTPFQFEQAKKERDLAASGLESARNQLADVEGSQNSLAALRVEQAASDLRRAETDFGETFLRAPFDGQIVEHLADKGEFVQAGQKVVAFIPDTPLTYAEVQADEASAGKFALGRKAILSSPAFPGKTYPASVERIGPIVDPQRGTFTVRLVTGKREPELFPESSVSVQIVVGEVKGVLLLEQRYIIREAGSAYVFTARRSRAKRVPVAISDLGNGLYGIVSGLAEGSTVLLPQGLRDGARVRVAPEAD